jgi:ABC-type phosphate/phosphonate transport system substrate-binding protein
MPGYATLAWYELPETRPIYDRLWCLLAGHLRAAGVAPVPDALTRPDDPHEALGRGDLTLAQICGFVAGGVGRDRLVPVATLHHAAPDCDGPRYRSLFTVRQSSGIERFDQLAGARAVISDPLSHSGCNALRIRVAALTADPFFASVATSGSHVASLAALRDSRADVAAIDCITWALLARYRPSALAGLTVLERSPLAPSPPLVTAAGNADQLPRMREALRAFFADPTALPDREAVLWEGFEILERAAYAALVGAAPDADGFDVHG